MATRFYFLPRSVSTPTITPAFDSGWEQTGVALRFNAILPRFLSSKSVYGGVSGILAADDIVQDVLAGQIITDPLPGQVISGTFSFVTDFFESLANANMTLAVVVRAVSGDGLTVRGTLFSVFGTDTEFSNVTTSARIVSAQPITTTTLQPGDRILVEVGAHSTPHAFSPGIAR
jgi:hypothetical protein